MGRIVDESASVSFTSIAGTLHPTMRYLLNRHHPLINQCVARVTTLVGGQRAKTRMDDQLTLAI